MDLDARPQGVVHVQRLVGVLAAVGCGLVHGHLGKRNLALALAAQVFVADAAAIHMAQRQAGQIVRAVGFEHIGLQHGVVRIAAHGDAVVGKHMLVIFDMLAQLLPGRILEPGPEPGQHLVQIELLGHVHALVAQRNIGGLAHGHAEGNADDAGHHLVQRIGLGIQRGQLGGLDLGQPFIELRLAQNRGVEHIALLGRHGHLGGRRVIGIEQAALGTVCLGSLAGLGRLDVGRSGAQGAHQALEAVFLVERRERGAIGLGQRDGIELRQAANVG